MERISISLGPTASLDVKNNALSGEYVLKLSGATGEFELVVATGGGGSGSTSISYAQFYTDINAGNLVQGIWYEIDDYQTVWDLPDFDGGGNPISPTTTYTESQEKIWVFCTAPDEISPIMFRPNYPRDEYKWDWRFNVTEVMGASAYGRISYCKDEYGNITDYDHRLIQFKRYEDTPGSGIYTSYKDTSGASDLFYTFQLDEELSNDGYVSSNNNIIGEYAVNFAQGTEPFILSNNVFAKYSWNNVLGSFSINNHFGGDPKWAGEGQFRNNRFGVATLRNLIEERSFGNECDVRFIDNTIGPDFRYNDLGFDFEGNLIGATFQYNTIGDGANGNNIYPNMVSNRIADAFIANLIFSNFQNNEIGDLFYLNTVGPSAQANRIGIECNNNIILENFQNNLIGDYFEENNIGENFLFNDIDSLFWLNTIGEGMEGNEIANFFALNTTSYNIANNYISNNFLFNDLGATFSYNVVTDDVDSCIMGDEFQRNRIETILTSVDFTSNPATHVYQTYNCQIFQNAAGTKRLLYYDSTDTPTIVNPDT